MSILYDRFSNTGGEKLQDGWYGSGSGFLPGQLQITEDVEPNPIMSDIEEPDDSRLEAEYPPSDTKC